MRKRIFLFLSMLLFVGSSVMGQEAEANQLRLWSSGDWSNDVCRSGTCTYATIEWHPITFRLTNFHMFNGHDNSVAVKITFSNGDVETYLYPTGNFSQVFTGEFSRYIEIIPQYDENDVIIEGDVEIEFIQPGLQSITFLTCTTDCGGQENVGNVFGLRGNQR